MNDKQRTHFYLGKNLINLHFNLKDFSNNTNIADLTNGKNRLDKHYDVPLKK